MKYLIVLLLLASCAPSPKPEFYIEGKGYITKEVCIEHAYVMEDSVQKLICIEYRTDTIEVK